MNQHRVKTDVPVIAYLLSAIVALYLTLGSSPAMKAAWAEDILSLLAPHGVPDRLAGPAPITRPAVPLRLPPGDLDRLSVRLHGPARARFLPIWLGWPMLAALAWSALPAVLLGRAKQPLVRELHDKVLVAHTEMNRADWLTVGAAKQHRIDISRVLCSSYCRLTSV